ncbi:complex I assembly factor ACAD9, mitochondrial [Amyelois transitella]|uniref:complex I assembly factor ACAD9, mitochondrial n=1 Tax=Amyelois transitella TaxID=680683 RepID=UPI00067DF6EA|nr:complex I assembly factor ACAD9, mitochondrial [Amyelois transitella]
MNLARQLCTIRNNSVGKNVYRKFRFSCANHESSHASQPQVQEEKFDFEDLKVFERVERRKPKIPPFMKDVFVSVYNKELLAYPEILNKEESEALDQRVSVLKKVFSDPEKSKEDKIRALKGTKMYAAPVPLTNNGLALNYTESIRYLEVISSDISLGQEISDHWVGLAALKKGLEPEQFNQIIDDLTSGDHTISLCIKERVAERISQADFRSFAELDQHSVWRVTGEKVCHKADGYRLVLCSIEGNRLRAYLIHPTANGVSHDGTFVTFRKTPATPLDSVTEQELAHILGSSRLHAATLCRSSLKKALHSCVEYVQPRALSGKPLSQLSTIRATIGEALLQIYASESAEYFTAGLVDGYEEPDAELEMAMCRNFISNHGLKAIMRLLSIPALEKELECKQLLDDMRHLSSRGESLDSINTFIALSGLQHAGKMMAEEVKQIRNPLMHPTFIIKKVLSNRHQEKDEPKLDLYLAEHLHPTLRPPAEQLEYCVLRMRFACETLMSRHGVEVVTAFTELNRLAEAASDILVMTSVLARASRAYCIGLRNAEIEMKLAACFVENTKERVRRLIKQIDDGEYLNLDHFKVQFGKKVLEANSTLVEKPTARTYW